MSKRMVASTAHFILLAVFSFALSSASFAEIIALRATLSGSAQVPSTDSRGSGRATFNYNTDTRQLRYTITYDGLSGPATGAHIHGPAGTDANAPVVVPFAVPESPISGTATLRDDIAEALLAGRLYVNVHTEAHRGGEIRGQIVR